MNLLEIVLIILGIVIIIISCILVDKTQTVTGKASIQPFSFDTSISEDDKKKLIVKLNDLISELSEETIIRTDDALSSISNEKIMAVSEFSDQILEKIKRNHDEVVFLYNMLNDKEKELKAAVKEIDASKKKVQDIVETKVSSEKNQSVTTSKTLGNEKAMTQASRLDNPKKAAANVETTASDILNSNNNKNILTLHSQGKSVVEISKMLGLGQGEVKLVIDLYKGKK